MDDALARGESPHRHPVVEAPAQGQDQVGIAQGVIGRDGPVHPRHPQVVGLIEGDGPQGVEGGRHRAVEGGNEAAQGGGGPGVDDAPACLDHRALGGDQGVEDGIRRGAVEGAGLAMALDPRMLLADPGQLHILADVHHHGAGAPGLGQRVGLAEDPAEVGQVLDQVVVLGDGAGDPDRVHLLEGIGPDGPAGHLARDEQGRDRVLVGVGDGGGQIGGPGPRGRQRDPHPTADPGITLGRVPCPALLAAEDELRAGVAAAHALVQLHMQRDHGTAGVAEDDLDPKLGEDVEEQGRAGEGIGVGTGVGLGAHGVLPGQGRDRPLIIP